MKLGEQLIKDKRITQGQLVEALESQVVQGGRLGSNLVELGFLNEQALADALSRQYAVPCIFGDIPPVLDLIGKLPANIANDKEVFPVRVEKGRVLLAMVNPKDLATMDTVAFRCGKSVQPLVMPEFRMHMLLRKHYHSSRPFRAMELGLIMEAAPKAEAAPASDAFVVQPVAVQDQAPSRGVSARPTQPPPAALPPPKPVTVASLASSKANTAPILPTVDTSKGRTAQAKPAQPARPAPAAPPPAAPTSVPPAARAPVSPQAPAPPASRAPSAPLPPATPPPSAPPTGRAKPVLTPAAWPQFSSTPPPEVPLAIPPQMHAAVVAEPPPEEEALIELTPLDESVPLTPLSFAEAQAALTQSTEREAVATNVLRFALSHFKRALILSVRRNFVMGWRAMGEGVDEPQLKQFAWGLNVPSSFKLVCDTSSHFIGAVREPEGSRFFQLLGGEPPATAVLMPLLARGRVVHLLYVDQGPGEMTPPNIGELLILSQAVARSYDALIQARVAA